MRILMTADTIGGVWTYALELAQALGRQGVDVAIATMGAPLTREQRLEIQQIPALEVFESCFKLEWMDDPWADIDQAGEWLLQLETQLQPDIVHLNGYVHGILPWCTSTLIVGHSCVLSWWQAVKGKAAPGDWDRYHQAVTQGLQAAKRVVAPSHAMLAALHQHYGPLPEARVIPNGRDPARFRPGEKSEIILSVGRLWDEAKNLSVLEQVASDLEWPIYVAGELRHPQGGAVEPDQVRLLGRLSSSALIPWLAQAAIYALPARYEPFGLSILEAGLAGCALVLGDVPSLREIWGEAALFVPPDDIEALRHSLKTLIANPERRKILAVKARDRARQFTPQRMAAGYLEVYAELTNANVVQSPQAEATCKS
jgi:glycosyltransferase involved in cell wall biosynthesis